MSPHIVQQHWNRWLEEGAVFGLPSGEFLLGVGPLCFRDRPDSIKPSFYAPDFLLQTKTPWLCCADVIPMANVVIPACLPEAKAKAGIQKNLLTLDPCFRRDDISWRPPQKTTFVHQLESLQPLLRQGDLQKGVPVVFAEVEVFPDLHHYILSHLLENYFCHREPGTMFAGRGDLIVYGFWKEGEGMIGATPELLFTQSHPLGLETMALAGTRSENQPWSEKERKEHQWVVQDITAALFPLGEVSVDRTEEVQVPDLFHWKTAIHLKGRQPVSFEQAVAVLHPTAALGVYPRTVAGQSWLEQISVAENRGRFGAPFGVLWPDGRSSVVVAIRNVQWCGGVVRLGAGCGVIAESDPEKEWEELLQKQESVRTMIGL